MSFSNSESSVTNSFRKLLDYVNDVGEHINQIYERLEDLEDNINALKDSLEASIYDNKSQVEGIKEVMVTKSEFNHLLQQINEPFTQFAPPKPSPTKHQEAAAEEDYEM